MQLTLVVSTTMDTIIPDGPTGVAGLRWLSLSWLSSCSRSHSRKSSPVTSTSLLMITRCINNRRRRRRGAPPMYGTSWLPTYGHSQKYHQGTGYPNQPYGGAAPPYSPPVENQATGNTFNSNDGYYGNHGYGQQSGIELQQPSSAYQPQRGGDPVYDAPAGPPPGKGDSIVR